MKIAGVHDIQTDIASGTCSFRLENAEIDYRSQLDNFAKTNPHLTEYSIQ